MRFSLNDPMGHLDTGKQRSWSIRFAQVAQSDMAVFPRFLGITGNEQRGYAILLLEMPGEFDACSFVIPETDVQQGKVRTLQCDDVERFLNCYGQADNDVTCFQQCSLHSKSDQDFIFND